jgi:2-methylcitrate dehydratase PrpD
VTAVAQGTETSDGGTVSMTRQLADFVAGVSYESLPARVKHNAARALVDWFAAALSGANEPATDKVNRVVAAVGPGSGSTIVGRRTASSPPLAALANGYASHLLDFDDLYNPSHTTIHLGSCLWPAVLALGEDRKVSGAAAMAGYVAGFEAGSRVAGAAGVRHYESGWHVTGTAGHLASAAAAANVLGLSGAATAHTLGQAATQAAGIREVYGSDTKPLHPAKAAMDGVLAALLAEQGFTSIDTAIEGPMGLLVAISPEPVPGRLVEGLGQQWNVLENGHKLYPSASLTHPVIDAVRAVLADRPVDPAEVRAVTVRMTPFAAEVTSAEQPTVGSAAKFSTAHCVAMTLRTGFVAPADFADGVVNDPAVVALRRLVTLVADRDTPKRGCHVRIELADGTVLEHEVEQNRGTPGDPLSDDELEAKLRTAAEPHLSAEAVQTLVERCWTVDRLTDLGELLAPLRS